MKPNSFFWSGWREVLLFSLGKISENSPQKTIQKESKPPGVHWRNSCITVGFQGCPLFLCPGCLTGKKIVQSNLQNEKQLKNCRPSGSEDTNPSGSEIRRRESCFFIKKKSPI